MEGLSKEWLTTLEDDDKVKLLEEIAVIQSIEDDGTISRNENVYKGFVGANIRPLPYGKSPTKDQKKGTLSQKKK